MLIRIRRNKKAFSLIELMIVMGISTGIGLYMSQMISNMNKQVRYLETKGDELEMKYMVQLNFTSKLACSRTIGGYCNDSSLGEEWVNKANCDSDSNWVDSDVEIKSNESQSAKGLNIYTFDPSNAFNLLDANSQEGSSSVGKLMTSNGGTLFQFCPNISNQLRSLDTLNEIMADLPEAIRQNIEDFLASHEGINNCNKAKHGRNIALSRAWIVNYPMSQGGVDVSNTTTGDKSGRVALVIEYIWLNNKEYRLKRAKVDLAVVVNSANLVQSCITQEDIEAFAEDQTYTVINRCRDVVDEDGNRGVWRNGDSNTEALARGLGSCSISCASGDQLVNGDPYSPSNEINVLWNCDMVMNAPDANTCDPCRASFDACPDACKSNKYVSYGCRWRFVPTDSEQPDPDDPPSFSRNLSDIPFSGVRALCVKRFSND